MGRRKQNKPKRACHDTVQSQSTSSSAPSGEGQHPNSQRKRHLSPLGRDATGQGGKQGAGEDEGRPQKKARGVSSANKQAAKEGSGVKTPCTGRKRKKYRWTVGLRAPSGSDKSSSSTSSDDSMDEDFAGGSEVERVSTESSQGVELVEERLSEDGQPSSSSSHGEEFLSPKRKGSARRGGRGRGKLTPSRGGHGAKAPGRGRGRGRQSGSKRGVWDDQHTQQQLRDDVERFLDVREVPMSHPLNEELVDTLRRHQAQAQARVRALRAQSKAGAPREDAAVQQQQAEGMEHRRQEYLVKWRSMSYRHAQWVPAATVQEVAKQLHILRQRLQRFRQQRQMQTRGAFEEEEEGVELQHGVNPQWLLVDRIVADTGQLSSAAPSQEACDGKGGQSMVLVKWKQLGYEHCSWEAEKDLVAEFGSELAAYRARCVPLQQAAAQHRVAMAQAKATERVRASTTLHQQQQEQQQGQQAEGQHAQQQGQQAELRQEHPHEQQAEGQHAQQQGQQAGRQQAHQQQQEPQAKAATGVGEGTRRFTATPHWLAKCGDLHPYQLEGLNWLFHKWASKENVVLADEMGLGKTVQAVALLVSLYEEQACPRPHLVVVPLSTLPNWERELATWAPAFNVVTLNGSAEARKIILGHELFTPAPLGRRFLDKGSLQERVKFNVLLTSYEILLAEASTLKSVEWEALIVDEGHRLKKKESKLFQELQAFKANFRLLLSGTPLQNNLAELFTLMHFLDPIKFASVEGFKAQLEDLGEEQKVSRLHALLAPHLLRRLKKDVLRKLPPKQEQIVRVELSPMQREFYKSLLARHYPLLAGSSNGELSQLQRRAGNPATALKNLCMELRKCCNHPYLFEGADPGYLDAAKALEHLLSSSGKLALLDRMMARLLARGHRILIYSQFTRTLDILEDWLAARKWGYTRIDGSIPGAQRQRRIDLFNREPDKCSVFLLSTRAGGVGINLATADTVIIFDSDWNPHSDLQAQARAHRLGQQRPVVIYRLVTRATIEERILQISRRKMLLEHLVVHKLGAKGNAASASKLKQSELDDILRYGAKELFSEDGPPAAPTPEAAAPPGATGAGAEGAGATGTSAIGAGATSAGAPGTHLGSSHEPRAREPSHADPSAQAPQGRSQAQAPGSGRIVYDDAALERLLDRSELEQKEWGSTDDCDEADDELFKAFKVANFNMVTAEDEAKDEEAVGNGEGGLGSVAIAPSNAEEERLLQDVCPLQDPSTADPMFWNKVLGSKYATILEQQTVTLGRGRRQRGNVSYGGLDASSSSESISSGVVSADDLREEDQDEDLDDVSDEEAVKAEKRRRRAAKETQQGQTDSRPVGAAAMNAAQAVASAASGLTVDPGNPSQHQLHKHLVCQTLDQLLQTDSKSSKLRAQQKLLEPALLEGSGEDLRVLGFNAQERLVCISIIMAFGLEVPQMLHDPASDSDVVRSVHQQAMLFLPFQQRLPHKPSQHIIAYVELLLQLCREAGQQDPQALHLSNGVPKVALLGPRLTVQQLMERIAIMHIIRVKLGSVTPDYSSFTTFKLPGRVWGPKHDCLLLYGVVRYGFESFQQILASDKKNIQVTLRTELSLPLNYDSPHLNQPELSIMYNLWRNYWYPAVLRMNHQRLWMRLAHQQQARSVLFSSAAFKPHDVDAMSVKQLKDALALRGADMRACVEKQDLVRALLSSQQVAEQHHKQEHARQLAALQAQQLSEQQQQLSLEQARHLWNVWWSQREVEWLKRRLVLLCSVLKEENEARMQQQQQQQQQPGQVSRSLPGSSDVGAYLLLCTTVKLCSLSPRLMSGFGTQIIGSIRLIANLGCLALCSCVLGLQICFSKAGAYM